MRTSEIRKKYIDFFKSKDHAEIPNAPLVPENDPSMLYINAGMATIVPFLLGEKHPSGNRLANVQRCVRTIDIDEVGDIHHCSAFEMLGNWSLNDYFKEEAINYTVEFYTKGLGMDINRMYVSVFEGDNDAPRDEESIEVWKKVFERAGIEAKVGKGERIQPFNKKENWWELQAGGPCGPDSEFFYDMGTPACGPDCDVSCQCGKYFEIGNNVFMEYLKEGDEYTKLDRHNVDFGGGVERIATVLQGKGSYYEVDKYLPILETVQGISKGDDIRSQRILVDHIKSATWIVMDGVTPGRTEQGYVLRRIIRKAIRHGRLLGIEDMFTRKIAEVSIGQFEEFYPMLREDQERIIGVIEEEELKFRKTLKKGEREFEKLVEDKGKISGEDAFMLFETYGFPVEITQEMAEEKGLEVDVKGFDEAYQKHKEKSRKASEGFFKGGLADSSEMSTKYHTATHLLNEALRRVLGEHVKQLGSNINPERLRFDFPNDAKLTPEQTKEVEDLINEQIDKGLEVYFEEMPKEKALELAPYSAFAEKYGDMVKVYFVGRGKDNFSTEICGGPHVENLKDLGKFKIIKQDNVGAGVKRIKAVLE